MQLKCDVFERHLNGLLKIWRTGIVWDGTKTMVQVICERYVTLGWFRHKEVTNVSLALIVGNSGFVTCGLV